LSQFFHLDNPVPDPVEAKTISNPNPKILYIRPDWTPKSGSCTPLFCTSRLRSSVSPTERWSRKR